MPDKKQVTRKLCAILSADVQGYSVLMADDEAFTIRTLKEYRRIMSTLISLSLYYKVNIENKLSGREIKELLFGRKATGYLFMGS